MTILLFILAAFSAFKALKARSPLGCAGAGALLAAGVIIHPDLGLVRAFLYMLTYDFLPLLITGGVAGAASYAYFKSKGILKPAKADTAEMKLLVGRVLDTKTDRTVYSSTDVSVNAMGHVDSYTSHETVITHNTWIFDLTNEIDVNYAGNGSLKARAGHILGTMSYKGRSLLDINFSTKQRFSIPATSDGVIRSTIAGAVLAVFGWAIFPVTALLSPLIWAGFLGWNGNGGAYTAAVVPGSHRAEALMTYGGAFAYLMAVIAFNKAHSFDDILSIVLALIAVLAVLFNVTTRAVKKKHDAFLAQAESELNRIFMQVQEKYAARAAAEVQAQAKAASVQGTPANAV